MPQGGGSTSGPSIDDDSSRSAQLFKAIRSGTSWSGNETNVCFLGRGDGKFSDVSHASGFDFSDDGRALTPIDWDHDGDLDVLTSNRGGPQIRFLRNDVPKGENHYLLVRLQGEGAINRDAIGARVTVYFKNDPPVMRTLRAGEGYQVQSSKWLHFGLGKNQEIEKLVVIWPNGKQESHTGLQTDSRYRLSYSKAPVRELSPLKMNWVHPDTKSAGASEEVNGRALTPSKLPLVPLPYTDLAGNKQIFTSKEKSGMTIVNFWGSWCLPCSVELNHFSKLADTFEKAGIKVLALAVDGLSDQEGDEEAVRKFMDPLDERLNAGFASEESLTKLRIIHDLIFEKRSELALPTSLIIDSEGRVAGYYEGPLEVKKVLELSKVVNLGRSKKSLTMSLPFPGSWLAAPKEYKLPNYGDQLIKKGYFEDAVAIYLSNQERYSFSPNIHLHLLKIGLEYERRGQYSLALPFLEKATLLNGKNAFGYLSLGDRYYRLQNLEKAKENYLKAVSIKPDLVKAQYNLAIVLLKSGQSNEAILKFKECVKLNGNHLNAHSNLAAIYIQSKKNNEAIKHLRKIVGIKSDYYSARFELGKLLEEENMYSEAQSVYKELIKLQPNHSQAIERLRVLAKTIK